MSASAGQDADREGTLYKQLLKNPKHRTRWTWKCVTREAADVLYQLVPYLVTKKREAKLGLRFVRECIMDWGHSSHSFRDALGRFVLGTNLMSDVQLGRREKYVKLLTEAKHWDFAA